MKHIIISILMLAFAELSAQNRIYVNALAIGLNNGQSWTDAYSNLQNALQIAQAGDEIWVAKGIYLPTSTLDRSISFEPMSDVRLYGGFAGNETNQNDRDWSANPTILSGDIGIKDDSTDNTFNIMYLYLPDTSTVIDGFIFQDAVAEDQISNSFFRGKSGGAIYIMGENGTAYPEIRNCIFRHNTAANYGGAVMVYGGNNGSVAPRFINCRFESNHAIGGYGGGLTRIGGSWIERGNDLEGCVFYQNKSGYRGGGFYYRDNERNDFLEINNCIFEKNESINDGGGVFLTIGRQKPAGYSIVGSKFIANSSDDGGALTSVQQGLGECSYIKVHDCLIENNINHGEIAFSRAFRMEQVGAIDSKAEISNCKFLSHTNWDFVVFPDLNYMTLSFFDNFLIKNNAMDVLVISAAKSAFIRKSVFDQNENFNTIITNNANQKLVIENCQISKNVSVLGDYFTLGNADTFLLKNSSIAQNTIGQISHATNAFSIVENCIVHDVNNELKFLSTFNEGIYSYCSFDDINCSILGNSICGPGNIIGLDPQFQDSANGDYSLLPCSPLINAGSNAAAAGILTDLAGNPRIQEGTVDIGAYEAPAFQLASEPEVKPACLGASNGSISIQPAFGCEPYVYQWDPAAGNGPELNGLPPGNYQLTLTDGSGRQILDTLVVGSATNPGLNPLITNIQCMNGQGGTIWANASSGTAPYHFEWQPAAADTALLTHLPAGTYALTVTDANGCQDSASASIALQGMISLMVDGQGISCFGQSDGWLSATPVTGAAPFDWLWQGWPGTGAVAEPLGPGNYAVTVSDAYGCTAAFTYPPMTAPDSIQIGTGSSAQTQSNPANGAAVVTTVSGGTSPFDFVWNTGEMSQAIAGLTAGIYTVTITDDHGCTASTEVEVKQMVGTEDPNLTGLLIYPNPAAEWVIISLPDFGGVWDLELIDVQGRVLKHWQQENANSLKVGLEELPSGAYYVRAGNRAKSGKIWTGEFLKR